MIFQRLLEAETQKQRLLHVQQALIDALPDEFDVAVNHDFKEGPPALLISGGWVGNNANRLVLIVRVPPPSSYVSYVSVTRTGIPTAPRRELEFDFPKELAEMVTCITENKFDSWQERWV